MVKAHLLLERGERLIADDVLHLARVLRRRLRRHTQILQQRREQRVPLVDLLGHRAPRVRQRDVPRVGGHLHIAAAAQKTHRAADTGLGIPHILSDIDRPHQRLFLAQTQNGLQIHLAGFLQMHRRAPFLVILYSISQFCAGFKYFSPRSFGVDKSPRFANSVANYSPM